MEIVIVHFQPLEYYPPVQNLLRILQDNKSFKITVLTTIQTKLPKYNLDSNGLVVHRLHMNSSRRILRLLKYFYFYAICLKMLLKIKPSKVLYFESISAFPAILYKLIFKNTRLLVHYHEYTTKEEYSNGMQLVKWNHFLEKKNYAKFSWISHTNKKRIQLFRDDHFGISDAVLHTMPNFPVSNWKHSSDLNKETYKNQILQLVYVGAISLEDTYIFELIDFIKDKPMKYELEIFSIHIPEELKIIIEQEKLSHIKYSGPIKYNDIPEALQNKDIGLILYKGKTLNYVHNAPNKLFEYLTCGLDVWFPKEMIGCYEYISEDNPKVVMVDFLNIIDSLENYSFSRFQNKGKKNKFSAEEACRELILSLIN